MKRVYNFNAGPSPMPLEVLEGLKEDLTDFRQTGMGITEISHRSKEFQVMLDETKALVHHLTGLDDSYKVVFVQGGGTMQFIMTAMNFLHRKGAYADTGVWTTKAMKNASYYGTVYEASSSKDKQYSYIPKTVKVEAGTDYLYLCANNTIYGTEYQAFPRVEVPIIADMSSNMLSRTYDFTKFDLVWAGVQKNLGAAGTALVIVKESLLERARTDIPEFFRYETYVKSDSTYNTPPVFSIYTVNRTLQWLEKLGGLTAMEALNRKKAAEIYAVIDGSEGFYRGHAVKEDRSRMNVTFTLETPELEAEFVEQAKAHGFIGLKGHRLVGGLRASLYNAVTLEAAEALAMFMKEFQNNH